MSGAEKRSVRRQNDDGSGSRLSTWVVFVQDGRGQTLQDYSMGIGVFILTIAIALTFVPSIIAPFTAPVNDSVTARADRCATTLTYSLSETVHPNVLNSTETATFFENQGSSSDLRVYLGLPETTNINVTVRNASTDQIVRLGGTRLASGEPLQNTATVASSRIVMIDGRTYRLMVELW